LASIADDVSPELALETIESVVVLGAFAGPADTAGRSTAPIALPGTLTGVVSPVTERDPVRDAARVRAPEPEVALAGRFVVGSFTNRAGTRAYRLYVSSGVADRRCRS
jgi:hypothetical protein